MPTSSLPIRLVREVCHGSRRHQPRGLFVTLTKAEETCLVTNSLKVRPHLESVVEIEEA
jgi:hypothetical protein